MRPPRLPGSDRYERGSPAEPGRHRGAAPPGAADVMYRHGCQFRKEQEMIQHRKRPGVTRVARTRTGATSGLDPTSTLYTALSDAISNMAHPCANPQAKNSWITAPQ